MSIYYMFGKYSLESLKNISAERTDRARKIIEAMGGQIILMNALIGEYDLAFVINFESNAKALEASLALNKATGISFKTWPAISISDFDEIAGNV